jgi:flagellar hook-associated protein 2
MTASSSGVRLGGLASGFDTESIVEQLLAVDQARIDKLIEEKEINNAKIQTWEDIAEQLRSLSDVVTKLRSDGSAGNTLFEDKIAASSNSTVATAIATSGAIATSYSLDITSLAREKVVYGSQKADGYTVSAGSFNINNVTFTTDGTESLQDVADKINAGAFSADEEIIANVIDNRLVLQTRHAGADASIYGSSDGSPPFDSAVDDPDNILWIQLGLLFSTGEFANVAQSSSDANLTVNGVPITSSSNTIDDSVTGVTFSLTNTGTSEVSVTHNTAEVKKVITDFVDIYNETRDLIKRIREAKLDDDSEFGLFSSDPLLRQLFTDVRSNSTGGVQLVNGDWEGSITASAATQGDNSITLSGFSTDGKIYAGDYFTLPGHASKYKVQTTEDISGGSVTLAFYPSLDENITAGDVVVPVTQSIDDFGVGVRTDSYSGVDGILGITDEAKLDSMLQSDMGLIKGVFSRYSDDAGEAGVARRLYDWLDQQIKITAFVSKKRSIPDVTIPGLKDKNSALDEQVIRLRIRMDQKRMSLIRKFADMENSISKSQSMGAALNNLSGGSQQQK